MKLCMVNTNPFWGGGEKWFYENAVFLAASGFEILFLTPQGGVLWQKLEEHPNITLCSFSVGNLSFLNPFKKSWLSAYLKMTRSDAVLMNSPAELKLVGPCAQKAGISNIIYRRGSAIPVKATAKNRYLLGHVASHIIANSQETKKTLVAHLGQSLEEKIRVIPNGILLPELSASPANPVFTIGTLGRLVHQKGIDIAIQIALELKKSGVAFKWLVGGEGKLRIRLQHEIDANNLTQEMELLGEITDLQDFFTSIDLYAHTARWEGFGYAIAEAMAYEKAVVAFDISSNPELVVPDETGTLVPFKHAPSFADAIKKLQATEYQRINCGKRGRERIKNHFTKEQQELLLKNFLDRLRASQNKL